MQTTAVKRVKLLIKRVTNGNLANTCLSAAMFLSRARPGEIMLRTNHPTWVVKSGMLIVVKQKHVLKMYDKSPGIRTPLYKETNSDPNDCCRICRIYVKISGRSKNNVFGYNDKDFHKHYRSVLLAVYMTQRDYLSEVPAGSCKVCKSLSMTLIILFTSAGCAVRVDSRAFPQK